MNPESGINQSQDADRNRRALAAAEAQAFKARCRAIVEATSGLAILVGAVVLAGWLLGIESLRAIVTGGAAMKANVAIAFMLIGASLWLSARPRPRLWQLAIAQLAAATIALLGVATLAEYFFRWELRIDELIVADEGVIYVPAPGRPAPAAAASFLMLGIALIAMRSPRAAVRRFVQGLVVASLLVSTLALVGYAYGVSSVYRLPPYSSMALPTAATFFIICFGMLHARPDFEIMAPMRSTGTGGTVARKLLPAILFIPLLGWLRLRGEHWGLYSQEVGLALSATTMLVVLVCLVWWSARSLNQIDVGRRRAEDALRESERVYRAIGESIDYGVWLCDPDGKNVYTSPSFLQLVGLTQEQCAEFGWGDVLHPHDAERTITAWKECVRVRGKWDWEHRFRGVDGHWHSVLARGVPVTDEGGKVLCWAGINLDISRLKRVEQQLKRAFEDSELRIEERTAELTAVNEMLRRSLEEKEVLLKEVHHRVKNNLQVVSSLLHLQSLHTRDRASVEMFQESQHRVRSMALIHERLYRTKDLAQIDFTDYISGLANSLFRSYNVDTDRIALEIDVNEVRLGIDTAVPCGLLINELVSNCLKHAFTGRERGCIRVELLKVGDSEALLRVRDDGVGLQANVIPESSETFGMQVVIALVDQLHGHLDVGRDAGTEFRVLFPRTSS
jgi:PAS domain S-box-containing protein